MGKPTMLPFEDDEFFEAYKDFVADGKQIALDIAEEMGEDLEEVRAYREGEITAQELEDNFREGLDESAMSRYEDWLDAGPEEYYDGDIEDL